MDGPGPVPDSLAEVFFVVVVVIGFLGLSFFTGLDAQLVSAVGSPGEFFGVGNQSFEGGTVYMSSGQVGDVNFAAERRLGFGSSGSEIGLCGSLSSDGVLTGLSVGSILESSRTGVTFSCPGDQQDLILHSQPFYSDSFSPEDLSFEGEFRPEVSCIVFRELSVSPVTGVVSGVNCLDVSSGESVRVVAR